MKPSKGEAVAIDKNAMGRVETLYQKYSDMVFRLGVVYMKGEQEAYDIVQEVFLKLLRHPREFRDENHEKAWILRVAINCCKDQLKSCWRKKNLPWEVYQEQAEQSLQGNVGDHGEDSETKQMVLEAVQNLPDLYKEVIFLFYYEEYSTEEIARLLHKNASTVRSRLQKARELLKESIREE